MPYSRPATMAQSPSTGGISFLSDSQNSVSVTESGSETQNDDGSPSMVSANPDWQRSVSASFSQLSLHFQAAAQAVASVPPSSDQTILALMERLDSIEDGQRRLAQELASLKEEFAALHNQAATLAENLPQPSQSSQPPAVNGISDLEAAIKTQAEALKLDQERMPARLHNALATKSPSPLRMPPLKNGKQPVNAPNTRGEFEHLTKERYEALLTAYGVPFSGDTSAKREALRAFLGIPTIMATK